MRQLLQLNFRTTCLLVPLLLLGFVVHAQTQLTGTIKDASGSALPGVNVIIKGTTSGTTTDANGKFSLVANPSDVLLVSFIGYKSQEVPVGNLTVINLTMEEDIASLEEVVVIGYGTQRKSDLTGAIGSVSGETLKSSVFTNIDQALQGRIAGVQVTTNSGAPGGAASIRIRGNSSISGSNEPLIVIDGIQFQGDGGTVAGFDWAGGANGQNRVNPLSTINPADIVSVEVLKDASATAIYGSRAANGVIIYTTKRGKSGQSDITYDMYYGMQYVPKMLDMMDLPQFAAYQIQVANEVDGITLNERLRDPSILGPGTDWQSEIYQQAPMQSHQLSISGGNENTQYAVSGGFFDQDGIVIGSGFKRYSTRVNLDNKINNWFKLETRLSFAKTDEVITLNDGGDGVISQALVSPPDVPVRDLDGNLAGPTQALTPMGANPVGLALLRNNTLGRQRLIGNLSGDIKLPVKGLVFRTEFGIDNNHNLNQAFIPTYEWGTITNSLNRLRQREENTFYWIWKNYLTYDVKLSGGHSITAMAGYEAQKSTWEGSDVTKVNLATNNLPVLSQGDQLGSNITGWKDASSLASYFGRVFYSFSDKYMATFTLRADGSSKFGPNNRWAYFPSVSLAWQVMKEDFMPDNNVLTDFKIRLGYGEVGNQAIPNYAFGSTLETVNTAFGTGYRNNRFSNPNLRWEASVQKNIGFDMTFWNGRVNLTTELYIKDSKEFLVEATLPDYLGGNGGPRPPYINAGQIQNKGIEITLNSTNIHKGDFQWDSDITFTLNRNELVEMEGNIYQDLYWYSEFQTATNTIQGLPLGSFYGYVMDRLFTSQEDILGSPVQVADANNPNQNYVHKRDGVWVGDIKFKDLNGDGVINTDDQTIIGNPNPDFSWGFNNRVTYKNFDFTVYLTGVQGGDILNYSRVMIEGQTSPFSNQSLAVVDRAQYEYLNPEGPTDDPGNVVLANPGTNIPRFSTTDVNRNNRMSSRFIEDGSYVRIQTMSLGYNLPSTLLQKAMIKRMRVYLTVQNLYTFTDYSGYDPEIGAFNQGPLLQNVDMGRYPLPRIFTLGGSITF